MAVRFGFTPIRVVCNNTLSAAESGSTSQLIRLIHSTNLYDNLETLRDMLDLSKASFTATVEQYQWLAGRDINEEDLVKYVRIVFDSSLEKEIEEAEGKEASPAIEATPTVDKVINLFENGKGAGLPGQRTYWGAYNAVNEFLMWERGQSIDNRLTSVWFADGYSLNKRALDVALKLAA